MNISQKYNYILSEMTPYIYSYDQNLKEFDLNAFSSQKLKAFSPFNSDDLTFFKYLKALDKNCFEDSNMAMEDWVFLDCAIMPGAITGFAIESSKASLEILTAFNVSSDYVGLIPLSMFIAIPMAKKDFWFAHNLSSANSFLKNKIEGLGLLTKAQGIKLLKISNLMGATQWNNYSLKVHTRLGKLKLESAATPIHSNPESIVYSCHFEPEDIENALSSYVNAVSNLKIDIDDQNAIKGLSEKVKYKDVYIVSGPTMEEEKTFVYLLES